MPTARGSEVPLGGTCSPRVHGMLCLRAQEPETAGLGHPAGPGWAAVGAGHALTARPSACSRRLTPPLLDPGAAVPRGAADGLMVTCLHCGWGTRDTPSGPVPRERHAPGSRPRTGQAPRGANERKSWGREPRGPRSTGPAAPEGHRELSRPTDVRPRVRGGLESTRAGNCPCHQWGAAPTRTGRRGKDEEKEKGSLSTRGGRP